MDETLFEAIIALCYAAEEEGFDSVAQGLELVLDVYLMERKEVFGLEPVFVSQRTRQAERIANSQKVLRQAFAPVSVSNDWFPLATVS